MVDGWEDPSNEMDRNLRAALKQVAELEGHVALLKRRQLPILVDYEKSKTSHSRMIDSLNQIGSDLFRQIIDWPDDLEQQLLRVKDSLYEAVQSELPTQIIENPLKPEDLVIPEDMATLFRGGSGSSNPDGPPKYSGEFGDQEDIED